MAASSPLSVFWPVLSDHKWLKLPVGLFLVAVVAAAAYSFGLHYGDGNQHSYWLTGLQLVDSELWKNDWYASETLHYHVTFSGIVALIESLPASAWLAALGGLFITLASYAAVYITAKHLLGSYLPQAQSPAWLAAGITTAVVACIAVFDSTRSVALSYLFDGSLQASTIASLGWILAFGLYMHGRDMAAGIVLALAGAVHANFLLLGMPLFGFALLLEQLTTGGAIADFIRRGLRLLLPSFVVFLLTLPMIIGMQGGSVDQSINYEALYALVYKIRAPHHYHPPAYTHELNYLLGWYLLALPVMLAAFTAGGAARRLSLLWLSLASMLLVSAVFVIGIYWLPVVRLFVWRAAPFAVLLSQLAFFGGLVLLAFGIANNQQNTQRSLRLLLLAVPCTLIGLWLIYRGNFVPNIKPLLLVIGLVTATCIGLFVVGKAAQRAGGLDWLVSIAAVLALAAGMVYSVDYALLAAKNNSAISNYGMNKDQQALTKWAKDNTPKDAIFAVPLEDSYFRLHARRAVVVDWKNTPFDKQGLVQWLERVKAVTGSTELLPYADARNAYQTMTADRAASIKASYGAEYLLLKKPVDVSVANGLTEVFSNGSYRLFRIP